MRELQHIESVSVCYIENTKYMLSGRHKNDKSGGDRRIFAGFFAGSQNLHIGRSPSDFHDLEAL